MESAPELRALLDALPVSVALWDRDVRIRYANRFAYERFGRPARGTPLAEIVHPAAVELSRRYIEGALEGRPQQVERAQLDEYGRRANAHDVWHIPNVVDGQVTGYCALAVDVTASLESFRSTRRAREEAASRDERLRAADDLERHNVMDDLAGALRRLDTAALHASDLVPRLDSVVDTIEKTTGELRATFPASLFFQRAPERRLTPTPMSMPIEAPQPGSGVRWPDALDGSGWGAEELRAVLDLLPAAVAVWDVTHTNLYANRAAVHWFGRADRAELRGLHATQIVGAEGFAANAAHVDTALAGHAHTVERSLTGPRGVRHVQAHYLPRVTDGVVDAVYIVVADVTARVQEELALQDLRAETARVRERERIADTLHNLVIQRLFAASLAASLPGSVPDEQLRTVQDGLVAALEDIESALGTIGAGVAQLELLPALAELVHTRARPRGLEVLLQTVGSVELVPLDVAQRVLAECDRALDGVLADPEARQVSVTLAADDVEVRLLVVGRPEDVIIDWRSPTAVA